MRITLITAGAAGMYCGSCMRDNTLVTALIELGHEALLVPTFTPITTDEVDISTGQVFMGGVNVYLQEKVGLFRYTPRFLDRLFNSRGLLKFVSRFSSNTDYSSLGNLTASMLMGKHGRQRKEVAKLVAWLKSDAKPEVLILTNALLSGIVPALKEALDIPVFTTLQGDDIFLDALPEADRNRCISLIREHDQYTTGYISTSQFYADFMSGYLQIPREKIHVIYPGLRLKGFTPKTPEPDRPPTLGYFARIAPEKGFANLVDAFLALKQMPGMEDVRLRYAGWMGSKNAEFHETHRQRLLAAGHGSVIERVDCPDHASKVRFYQSIDVLSVPTTYREPKGLYVLEAWAAGVPVVQPEHGSFPELLAGGGGLLVPPNDAQSLATAIRELLLDRQRREALGQAGLNNLHANFTAQHMAEATLSRLASSLRT